MRNPNCSKEILYYRTYHIFIIFQTNKNKKNKNYFTTEKILFFSFDTLV